MGPIRDRIGRWRDVRSSPVSVRTTDIVGGPFRARNGLTLYSLQAHRLPSQSYCAGAGLGGMLDTFQPLGVFTDHQP
jgi:hypothetical protein